MITIKEKKKKTQTYLYLQTDKIAKKNSRRNSNKIIASKVNICNIFLPSRSNSNSCLWINKQDFFTSDSVSKPIDYNTMEVEVKRWRWKIPDRTGWTLFKRMEKAKVGERLATSSATASLVVKMYEILPLRNKKTKKNMIPIKSDVKVADFLCISPSDLVWHSYTVYIHSFQIKKK